MIKQLGIANQTEIFRSSHVNNSSSDNNKNTCSGSNSNDSKTNQNLDTPTKMLAKKKKEIVFNYFIANKVCSRNISSFFMLLYRS